MEVLTTQVGGAGGGEEEGGGVGGRMRGGRDGNERGLLPTTHITEGGVMLPNAGMQLVSTYVRTSGRQPFNGLYTCGTYVYVCVYMCVVYVRCSVRGDRS